MINHRYTRYAWAVLGVNVFVIIWGAYVRASGSGAGCGNHWPLCNGVLIPQPERVATLIEFAHRITSGLALLGVVGLVIWGWRAYPKGHPVRAGAVASMVFMIIEALIGAALVLFAYVAFNVSAGRAFWMAGHLVNTLLLTGALALTAWWTGGGGRLRLRGHGATGVLLISAIIGMFVLGVSGAITALGDTLVLAGGIAPEENAIVGGLVELRIYHPLIAILVGSLVTVSVWLVNKRQPTHFTQRFGWATVALLAMQLLLGTLNVALKAPVWLQMVHLLITTLIWISFVLLCAAALGTKPATDTENPGRAARAEIVQSGRAA